MVETGRKPPQENIFGEGFHLERVRKKVFLLDSEGGAVASCNMKSVDGRDFKKTLKDIIGLEEQEINKITAKFQLKHQKHSKQTHDEVRLRKK
ncbi:MAG TPA: hypothetical protein VMW84_01195 [Acidobacteriota bacterium]|nr:hypothetical protein [Acidobacteriota bacterium]